MKKKLLAVLLLSIFMASCRENQTPTIKKSVEEIIEVDLDSEDYQLCDAENAQFSLIVDFKVKDATIEKTATFHFPKTFSDDDHFFSRDAFGICADGNGGGYYLSYQLSEVTVDGVTFDISCSWSRDDKRGKVEKKVFIPWFKPLTLDNEKLIIKATWMKK